MEAHAKASSFDVFFRANFAYVLHCLRRLGVMDADLDDVAQDVFVAVHRHFSEYDANRSAKAWLFSFAARTAANYRRLARHRHETREVPGEDRSRDPELSMYRAEQLAWIRSTLLRMKEDRRNVLIMHDMDGLSAPEIAAVLDLPLNTVYSRVRRGREEFRKIANAISKERP